MSRLSRETRLFYIFLWTMADDAGRLPLDHAELIDQLYPFDPDAPMLLPVWLGELEAARCIEIYRVNDAEYLRIVNWRRLQTIDRPTRSRLPAAPSERSAPQTARDVREGREPRGEHGFVSMLLGSDDDPREEDLVEESTLRAAPPGSITPERVLGDLDYALRKSIEDDSHASTARYLELLGRHVGLWPGREAGKGGRGKGAGADGTPTPSPAEIHGLPDTSRSK